MNFASPWMLLSLWLVPGLIALLIYGQRRRTELLTKFAEAPLLVNLLPHINYGRRRLKATLVVLGVALLCFTLAGPRWGYKWETLTRKGVDILVAVDVSNSMKATDIAPDRLQAARRELTDLVTMLQGDRVGLIAYAGTPFVLCPLTLDYGAFSMFLTYLETDLIPVQGTAIGDAIRKAIDTFDPANRNSRALILITDGEDHEGQPLEAAKAAKEAGITIYTIGIGDPGGAPVPDPDGGGFLKSGGEMVISKMDEESLQRIALETGGAYVRATSGDLDLDTIYRQGIRRDIDAQELKSERQKRWEERFQWPLGLAILLLLLEGNLRESRARSTPGGKPS